MLSIQKSMPGTSLILLLWFGCVGFVRYNQTDLSGDLGELVNDPVRILRGELPYRDFWLLHPPGEAYLPALLYRFAYSVNLLLLFNICISVLIGLVSFWITSSMSGSRTAPIVAASLTFFAGVPYQYAGYAYLHAYFLALLIAASQLLLYLQTHHRRPLFLAGVAIGIAFLFRTYLTGAAAAAVFVTVTLESRRRPIPWSSTVQLLFMVCLGCTLILGMATVLLYPILPAMWHAVMVDSLSHATINRTRYGVAINQLTGEFLAAVQEFSSASHFLEHPLKLVYKASNLLKITALHVLPFVSIGFWVMLRRVQRHINHASYWMLVFFFCWGCLTFIRAFSRGGHPFPLSQAATPLFFALALLCKPWIVQWQETRRGFDWVLAAVNIVLIISLGQAAILQTAQRLMSLRHPVQVVTAPHGSLIYKDESEAKNLQTLIDRVLSSTSESDFIFVVPWDAPAIYALTGRRNPTFYGSNIDLFYRPTEEKEKDVCRALQKHHVKLIISQTDWPGVAWNAVRQERLIIVDSFIHEHFERVGEFGFYSLYERKSVNP